MNRTIAASILLACAVSGCSAIADTTTADQDVAKIHAMIDAGEFEQIYDGSSATLKKMSARERFVPYMDAIHRKLGNVKSSTRTGVNINFDAAGEHIVLTYKTSFAGGEGMERFDFRKDSTEPLLSGYHVASPALAGN